MVIFAANAGVQPSAACVRRGRAGAPLLPQPRLLTPGHAAGRGVCGAAVAQLERLVHAVWRLGLVLLGARTLTGRRAAAAFQVVQETAPVGAPPPTTLMNFLLEQRKKNEMCTYPCQIVGEQIFVAYKKKETLDVALVGRKDFDFKPGQGSVRRRFDDFI